MPRSARLQSETNIYHVMLRGINQQQIFWEEEDYRKFLYILEDCKKLDGFQIHAYCLMGNHVHILIEVCEEPLSKVMKRLGCRYVYWYNVKYQRTGHLFQDRYRSEVIANDDHFLRVLRYILKNPVKAGITISEEIYPWSSIAAYIGKNDYITDVSKAISLSGSRNKFIEYINLASSDMFLDISYHPRMTDERAWEIIEALSGCRTPYDFQKLDKQTIKKYIQILNKQRLSIRRISRLSGISKAIVEAALK